MKKGREKHKSESEDGIGDEWLGRKKAQKQNGDQSAHKNRSGYPFGN
jgi:hypothetical protein